MKWDNLKRDVAGYVYQVINEVRTADSGARILTDLISCDFDSIRGQVNHTHDIARIYAQKAHDVVMAWDVRLVGKLRDAFPDGFPPGLRNGRLGCELTDKGWEVFKIHELRSI